MASISETAKQRLKKLPRGTTKKSDLWPDIPRGANQSGVQMKIRQTYEQIPEAQVLRGSRKPTSKKKR